MTVKSFGFTRANSVMLSSFELCLLLMSVTISPRDFSCSATACFESASTSPFALAPARSSALKTNVAMRAA